MSQNQTIYSPAVIEFVTVVAETCLFLEQTSTYSKSDFISKMVKLLPLLYLKTTLIERPSEDEERYMERFVQEDDYYFIKNQVETILGEDDSYLEVFDPNMPYSDTPIAAFISETMADIYQELKDFTENFKLGEEAIMTASLYACIDAFVEHWGQKLTNALRAFHALNYGMKEEENWDDDKIMEGSSKIKRQGFLDFQNE